MTPPLRRVLAPETVAVIGVSADPTKMGSAMADSLAGFGGTVLAVNERTPDTGAGIHRSVAEAAEAAGLPAGSGVDLAVLCIPAPLCAGALQRLAGTGVGGALICAGGFAEAGGEGERAQEELVAMSRRHAIRVLGPNTSGFFAPGRGLYATFVPGARGVPAGGVGVVAASGGVNHALAFLLARAGHGISLAVGLGNAVDIGTADVIEYLAEDPATRVIALHIESVSDGPRLLAAVRHAAARKPVVALVVGRSDIGDFARSHTGALATAWRTTRALLAQAGAVLVDDDRELVDAVGALALSRLPAHPDPGVALVTAQAGPGLLIMDQLRGHGVRLPPLSDVTREAVGRMLPPLTYQSNPVDTGRPGESFASVVHAVADDRAVDLVAVYALTEPGAVDLADAIRLGAEGDAVLSAAVGGVDNEVVPVRDKLHAAEISVATSPTGLARAVRALVTDARQRHGAGPSPLPAPALAADVDELVSAATEWTEHDAKNLLDALGIATPKRIAYQTREAASGALGSLRPPLAVKLLDAQVLHKTEVGGVHLGIGGPEQLDDALCRLVASGATRFLVEEMAADGVDLILGARRDPVFGPVVLLGLGGTIAEALGDVALRAAPLSVGQARAMTDELLGRDLLYGWRGGPELDLAELARSASMLGRLLAAHDQLDEVEINPLRLTHDGLIALDAVITTRRADGHPHQ